MFGRLLLPSLNTPDGHFIKHRGDQEAVGQEAGSGEAVLLAGTVLGMVWREGRVQARAEWLLGQAHPGDRP